MTQQSRAAYERHVADIAAQDLDAVVAGYAPDALVVGPAGSGRGHEFVRSLFAPLLGILNELDPDTAVHEAGDVVLVTWRSRPGASNPGAGADTFVFHDGLITVHIGASLPDAG